MLRRESTPDVADGVFPVDAFWDGRHGHPANGEVPAAVGPRRVGDAHVRRTWLPGLGKRPRFVEARR